MQRIDDDIKATVKKIIQGNEKRKRRMLNGNASAFDHMTLWEQLRMQSERMLAS